MRVLVWLLGVICTMAALMNAYAIAPRWAWVFWSWLGLWVVVGVAVVIAAAVRLFAPRLGPRGAITSVPQRSAPQATQGGE